MKVIRKNAKGKEVMLVQKGDMAYLATIDIEIPAAIYLKAFGSGLNIVDVFNCNEYAEFSRTEEITYFKKLEFIVDGDEFNKLSKAEVEQRFLKLVDKIEKQIDYCEQNPKKVDQRMQTEIDKNRYKLNAMESIYYQKADGKELHIPPMNYGQDSSKKTNKKLTLSLASN